MSHAFRVGQVAYRARSGRLRSRSSPQVAAPQRASPATPVSAPAHPLLVSPEVSLTSSTPHDFACSHFRWPSEPAIGTGNENGPRSVMNGGRFGLIPTGSG